MGNGKDIQNIYNMLGEQKIEIVLDKNGVHSKGPQNISAPLMIVNYLLDYYDQNPSGFNAETMTGALITLLESGFNMKFVGE